MQMDWGACSGGPAMTARRAAVGDVGVELRRLPGVPALDYVGIGGGTMLAVAGSEATGTDP